MSSEINDGWEERFQAVKDKPVIEVSVSASPSLAYGKCSLSREDQRRLLCKLQLVEDEAEKMALAMLKGTLKYKSDDLTPEQWNDHSEEERIDQNNYLLLKRRAERQEKLAATQGENHV